MTLGELLKGIAVEESNADLHLEISGVSYDSRKTKSGDLFVAMTGYAADGHAFIPMAAEKGAVCVLCEREPEVNIPWIKVSSSRKALAKLAANWFGHPAEEMTMIGVTGTNGKTTTGEDDRRQSGTDRHQSEYDRRPDYGNGAHHTGVF